MVINRQLVFRREIGDERVLVILNSEPRQVDIEIEVPWQGQFVRDLLDPGFKIQIEKGRMRVTIPPTWGRILEFK